MPQRLRYSVKISRLHSKGIRCEFVRFVPLEVEPNESAEEYRSTPATSVVRAVSLLDKAVAGFYASRQDKFDKQPPATMLNDTTWEIGEDKLSNVLYHILVSHLTEQKQAHNIIFDIVTRGPRY